MTVTIASAGKLTAWSWELLSEGCLTESMRESGTNFGWVMSIKIPEPSDNRCLAHSFPAVI